MFSSSNPFPSSIHGLPPSGIFLGQEINPFFTGEYCSFDNAPPHVKESAGLQNCDNNNNENSNTNYNIVKLSADSVISPSRKRVAASKKDRHSKIFTAQGPRDRRVRLSIDISKKFFGLQDLLGYDKASKTLDWLFTRSKAAIKDLVEEMRHTSSSTLSDQCEEVFMEKGSDIYVENNGRNEKKKKGVAKSIIKKKKKKTTQDQHKSRAHVDPAARSQLRAEARSRARERTQEKLRIKKLNNDTDYCYQLQSQTNHDVKIGETLTTQEKPPKPYSLLYNSKDSRSQFKNSCAH